MAKRNSSKVLPAIPTNPSDAELIRIGRNALTHLHELDERAKAQRDFHAKIEQREREGVTLKGDNLERVERALSDINMAAVSVHHLAIDATDCPEAAEHYQTAILNIAKVICRKADLIAAEMGDAPAFGNFVDEFEIPAKRAA